MEELMEYLKHLNEELLKISMDRAKVMEWQKISSKYPPSKECSKEMRCKKALEEEKFLAKYTTLKRPKTKTFKDKGYVSDSVYGDLVLVNNAGFALFLDLKVGSANSVCGAISSTSYLNFTKYGVYILINANFSRWYIIPKRVLLDNKSKWSFVEGEIHELTKFKGYAVFRDFNNVIYTDTGRGLVYDL